jgi:hypothetical protein
MRAAVNSSLSSIAARWKAVWRPLTGGLFALVLAMPLAWLIGLTYRSVPGGPERAVLVTGALLGVLVLGIPLGYLILRGRTTSISQLAYLVLALVSTVLVGIYTYQVSFQVRFPADILTWSESDFVNDILKLRVGYPLFTAQVNNESFTYPPGPQLLTYAIAALLRHATSIPTYRVIQLGYTGLASIVGLFCVFKLIGMARPPSQPLSASQGAFWLPFLFLVATNSLTNPFVHNLHDDALALLVSVFAFWLLLEYASSRRTIVLVGMAVVPAVGFLVKQSLLVWAVLYGGYLLLFVRPRSARRAMIFGGICVLAIAVVLACSYLLWGEPFFYWVVTVLGEHGVSPLRGFQHLLDVWSYCAAGVLAGFVLLRGDRLRALLGPWLIWLALLALQIYTSGVAWMLNHIGPASLIACVWLLVALWRLWPLAFSGRPGRPLAASLLPAATGLALILVSFAGLALIRIPLPSLSEDAYRYIAEIEAEFQGQDAHEILLDVGTWVYLKDGVVMKDRAPGIGERGYSTTGDFSGILDRIGRQQYAKILVRNLHSPDFWYDHELWRASSGIRQALLDNYREARTIPAVEPAPPNQNVPYTLREISVLVPRSLQQADEQSP